MHLSRAFLPIRGALRRILPILAFSGVLTLPGTAGCQAATAPNPPIPPTAKIWFHPKPSNSATPGGQVEGGSTDYLKLFQPNAP